MTQEQIKAAADAIHDRMLELRGKIDIERAKLGVVQSRCKHPGQYATSCMGDPGIYCPDCGWAR